MVGGALLCPQHRHAELQCSDLDICGTEDSGDEVVSVSLT